MKAAQMYGPSDIRYVDVEVPSPGPDEVLVRVKIVGLCGSDTEIYLGTLPYFATGYTKYPLIAGHEWVGVVEQVGNNVRKIKIGDTVVGDAELGCGVCHFCMRGLASLCPGRVTVGFQNKKQGAFAEYFVNPERHTYIIPAGVDYEEAAFAEPASTIVYALERCPIRYGDVVVILGDGPIGLTALQLAKAGPSSRTIISGTVDRKLELAGEFGADITVNVKKENLEEEVKKVTDNLGADIVFECSGSLEAAMEAFKIVQPGGRIVLIGVAVESIKEFDISNIVLSDLNVYGINSSPMVMPRTLKMLQSRQLNLKPLITHRFPLSRIKEAFELQVNKPEERIKIMLTGD